MTPDLPPTLSLCLLDKPSPRAAYFLPFLLPDATSPGARALHAALPSPAQPRGLASHQKLHSEAGTGPGPGCTGHGAEGGGDPGHSHWVAQPLKAGPLQALDFWKGLCGLHTLRKSLWLSKGCTGFRASASCGQGLAWPPAPAGSTAPRVERPPPLCPPEATSWPPVHITELCPCCSAAALATRATQAHGQHRTGSTQLGRPEDGILSLLPSSRLLFQPPPAQPHPQFQASKDPIQGHLFLEPAWLPSARCLESPILLPVCC